MDKKTYLAIRNELKASKSQNVLLRYTAVNIILLAGTIGWALSFATSPWQSVAGIGLAILMFRSFAMMHEASHTVIKPTAMNDWLGVFYGGVALLAFEPWKRSHLEHHYWSGNVERDPVMALIISYPKFPSGLRFILTLAWRSWLPVLAILQHAVFWLLSVKNIFSSQLTLKAIVSVVWPLLLWGGLVAWIPSATLLKVFVPGVILYLAAVEIVNLPHHLRLPQMRGDAHLPVWQQYETVRTCLYPQWLASFVVLNFNYHTEHHVFPDMPWYHLPAAHVALKKAVGEKLNIDANFLWTVRHRGQNLDELMKSVEQPHGNEAPETSEITKRRSG